MVADHFQCDPFAGVRELDAPVALVLYESEVAESLDHVGHGRRRHSKPLRDAVPGDRSCPRLFLVELVDGLEIVLDGRCDARFIARDGKGCVHAATRRAVRYMTAIPAATPPNVAQVSAGSPAFCCERQMRRATSTITCRIAPMPMARKMVVQNGE